MAKAKDFATYAYEDARKLFDKDRRAQTAVTAREFYNSNHWQEGRGFLGQLAPTALQHWKTRNEEIKAGFISQNACKRVIERHLNGVFDRESVWGLVTGETDESGRAVRAKEETLTRWWDERGVFGVLQEATRLARIEGASALRFIIPRGRLPEGGQIPDQTDLAGGLDFVYFEALTADKAGVFTDPETRRQIGVYLFDETDGDGKTADNCAELSFLNAQGDTVWRVVRAKGRAEEFGPYKLGGRLFVHEIRLDSLITEQVQSLQKGINLNHTMMLRNVNIAGSRERNVSNAQLPKTRKKVQDPENPTVTKTLEEPGYYVTGGGAVNYHLGYPIYNEKGHVAAYTNPNVSITDPVDVTSFLKTHEHYYTALLDECDQLHFLMGSDATANGVSREQARADYERSLKTTKHATDATGRWMIETPLRFAAQLARQSEKYLKLRAEFNAVINTGPLSAAERQENRADVAAGLLSRETAMSRNGVEDTGAEQERIDRERGAQAKGSNAPPGALQEDKTGAEDLPA